MIATNNKQFNFLTVAVSYINCERLLQKLSQMIVELVTKNELFEVKEMLTEILERLPKLLTGNKKEFLTAKEVKEILKCSDGTLSNYRNSNILAAKKVGGRFYYSQADLNKLLNNQKGGNNGK